MYDPVEDSPVLLERGVGAEDTFAEDGAVQAAVWEEEVGGAGTEVGCDCGVSFSAGLDDLAREEVGVDYGEVVGRGGEDGGDGGFARRDGAGEADEEHCWRSGVERGGEGWRGGEGGEKGGERGGGGGSGKKDF